jgi:regulator of cell morphogenesis and NO signaling
VKEEHVLFPYIKEMVVAKRNNTPVQHPGFGSVRGPINMMEMEHESAGKNLATIRSLSQNYTLPSDACASYSLLFRMLEEFEDDLFSHVHLENNILFPKALALEETLQKG